MSQKQMMTGEPSERNIGPKEPKNTQNLQTKTKKQQGLQKKPRISEERNQLSPREKQDIIQIIWKKLSIEDQLEIMKGEMKSYRWIGVIMDKIKNDRYKKQIMSEIKKTRRMMEIYQWEKENQMEIQGEYYGINELSEEIALTLYELQENKINSDSEQEWQDEDSDQEDQEEQWEQADFQEANGEEAEMNFSTLGQIFGTNQADQQKHREKIEQRYEVANPPQNSINYGRKNLNINSDEEKLSTNSDEKSLTINSDGYLIINSDKKYQAIKPDIMELSRNLEQVTSTLESTQTLINAQITQAQPGKHNTQAIPKHQSCKQDQTKCNREAEQKERDQVQQNQQEIPTRQQLENEETRKNMELKLDKITDETIALISLHMKEAKQMMDLQGQEDQPTYAKSLWMRWEILRRKARKRYEQLNKHQGHAIQPKHFHIKHQEIQLKEQQTQERIMQQNNQKGVQNLENKETTKLEKKIEAQDQIQTDDEENQYQKGQKEVKPGLQRRTKEEKKKDKRGGKEKSKAKHSRKKRKQKKKIGINRKRKKDKRKNKSQKERGITSRQSEGNKEETIGINELMKLKKTLKLREMN